MELTIYNCISNFKQIHNFNTYLENNDIEINVINKNNYLYYSIDEQTVTDFNIIELLRILNL